MGRISPGVRLVQAEQREDDFAGHHRRETAPAQLNGAWTSCGWRAARAARERSPRSLRAWLRL